MIYCREFEEEYCQEHWEFQDYNTKGIWIKLDKKDKGKLYCVKS